MLVAAELDRYGFTLADDGDNVYVQIKQPVSLKTLAKKSGTFPGALRAYNDDLRESDRRNPVPNYILRIPEREARRLFAAMGPMPWWPYDGGSKWQFAVTEPVRVVTAPVSETPNPKTRPKGNRVITPPMVAQIAPAIDVQKPEKPKTRNRVTSVAAIPPGKYVRYKV